MAPAHGSQEALLALQRQVDGLGNVHLPPTHRAGSMQCAPVSVVLHDAPSAPTAVHVPLTAALQVPALGQTAMLLAKTELAPQVAPASVSAMHLSVVDVLHPTW
jgi:hypothetical protein